MDPNIHEERQNSLICKWCKISCSVKYLKYFSLKISTTRFPNRLKHFKAVEFAILTYSSILSPLSPPTYIRRAAECDLLNWWLTTSWNLESILCSLIYQYHVEIEIWLPNLWSKASWRGQHLLSARRHDAWGAPPDRHLLHATTGNQESSVSEELTTAIHQSITHAYHNFTQVDISNYLS